MTAGMWLHSPKAAFAPAALLAGALCCALALQHLLGWLPCPLCIVQRLTALLLLAALVGFGFTKPRRPARHAWLWIAGLAAVAGAVAAGAHLWLLVQPQAGACGPGLARWVGNLVDAIPGSQWLLEGVGGCEDARYVLAGVPLPAWSGATHLASAGLAIVVAVKQTASAAR